MSETERENRLAEETIIADEIQLIIQQWPSIDIKQVNNNTKKKALALN